MSKFASDDTSGRYDAGKTIKDIEFGVLYPDGTVEWNPYHSHVKGDLQTPEGRADIIKEWNLELQRRHAVATTEPRFIKRTKTTKFSDVSFVVD